MAHALHPGQVAGGADLLKDEVIHLLDDVASNGDVRLSRWQESSGHGQQQLLVLSPADTQAAQSLWLCKVL